MDNNTCEECQTGFILSSNNSTCGLLLHAFGLTECNYIFYIYFLSKLLFAISYKQSHDSYYAVIECRLKTNVSLKTARSVA